MPAEASPFCIASVVEGQGEVAAVPVLITRIVSELFGLAAIPLNPVRLPREKIIAAEPKTLEYIQKLSARVAAMDPTGKRSGVLVLVDADEDCPASLFDRLRRDLPDCDAPVFTVAAKLEYETWFVASAETLGELLNLEDEFVPVVAPEQSGQRKRWIRKRIKAPSYRETADQRKLTSRIDLGLCRSRCPSFDKLCRDLESLMTAQSD